MAARRSHELQADEELGDLFSAVALVLDGPARWPRRRAAHGEHALASSGRADVARPEAEIGGGVLPDLFLLRAHDALQRGIARLVDPGGGRHQPQTPGRQRGGAALALAVAPSG